ncbi:MAG: hypothetical protein R6X02_35700 [Enhygromyxa sp.]
MRRLALTLGLAVLLLAPACAGNRAYLDWRPGLSEIDFEGLFEISIDEYQTYADEAASNVSFERRTGPPSPEAAAAMAELGERIALSSNADPRGYAIAALGGDGSVTLTGDRGQAHTGSVDWFATSSDRRWAALLTGTKLAVAVDGASTGIDVGSLLGAGRVGGYKLIMLPRDGELSVFALPELGGSVSANEPGYLFSFRYQPGAREAWDISVARVVITI